MPFVTLLGRNEGGKQSIGRMSASGAIKQIAYEHQTVHEDGIFIASDYQSAVSTGGVNYLVTVPSTGREYHSQFDINADGPAYFELRELSATEVTAAGTKITIGRYNRGSTISDTEDYGHTINPTLASEGSLLFESHNCGTTGRGNASNVGGRFGADEEFVIEYGKPILLKIVPDGAGTKVAYQNICYDVPDNY